MLEYGVSEIYEDARGLDRPELARLMERMSDGDIMYVVRLSQLGRTFKQMILLSETLRDKGVKMFSLFEKLDLTIFFSLAEADKAYLLEKNPAILEKKAVYGRRGNIMGRKPIDESIKQKALELYRLGRPLREIREKTGLSNTTIYKTIRKHQAGMDMTYDLDEYYGQQ